MIVLEWLDRELRNLGWSIVSINRVQGIMPYEMIQISLSFNDGSPVVTTRIINSPQALTEDLLKFIKEYKELLDDVPRDTP